MAFTVGQCHTPAEHDAGRRLHFPDEIHLEREPCLMYTLLVVWCIAAHLSKHIDNLFDSILALALTFAKEN